MLHGQVKGQAGDKSYVMSHIIVFIITIHMGSHSRAASDEV